MKKNNKMKKVVVSTALAVMIIGTADKAFASSGWEANSIETIESNVKQDNQKYNNKEYDIRWGDYLYGISQATNVDIDTLAQINSIANKNLIIAGNKLYYGADSNIVTKDNNTGETKVYQQRKYDGSNEVKEAPKKDLSGKEEQAIVEKNPSLSKDFSSKDKINDKIIKDNKNQIKDLDEEIKDIKKDADKKIKEQEDIKKDLEDKKDKLVKEGKEKNKDKIAEIDEKIKETDKKIEDIKKDRDKKVEEKEKQKDYLQTENEKIEADKKGDKKKADEKQKELEDKKDNDPYEIWKKEQKEKNPNLKDEDLTKEQYEIWKKNKDKKPDVKPEEPSEPEKPADPEKPSKDDPKDPEKKPEEKPNPDKPKEPENPKDPEDKPEEPKEPEQPTEPEKPEDEVVVKEVYEEVPFNTVRAINDPNLKTRVFQKGVNGKDLYKVTYKNGEVVKKDFVKTVSEPVDEIIQSYVKVKDAEYETRYKERFFARGITREDYDQIPLEDLNVISGEDEAAANAMYAKYEKIFYFDTYEEAQKYFDNFILGNFGSADPVEETVKVSDEVWEWQ